MKRLALAVLLALQADVALSGDVLLVVSTYSWHADDAGRVELSQANESKAAPGGGDPPTHARVAELNKKTWGGGVGYSLTPTTDILVGAYRNSNFERSRYAVATYRLHEHMFVAAGYLDGYGRTPIGGALGLELGPAVVLVMPKDPLVLSLWFKFRVTK
jgi:hypothetical protein